MEVPRPHSLEAPRHQDMDIPCALETPHPPRPMESPHFLETPPEYGQLEIPRPLSPYPDYACSMSTGAVSITHTVLHFIKIY
jgi:hypothetical protein